MEQSIHLPAKSRIRVHHKTAPQEEGLKIKKASFIAGKKILIEFSNGKSKMVDFEPIFKKYVKGDFSFFADPIQFKSFKVAGGNLFWGENEDVIFPVQSIYNSRYSKLVEEEILYIL